MSLFPETLPPKPLPERMRPKSLEDVIGQRDVCQILSAYVDQGNMPSLVFWGPPGTGKTTLSRLMASLLGWEGRSLNATSASVKDIRDVVAEAKLLWSQMEKRTLLFIDEIHRLNKTQQDVLLPFVESGAVVLAGSTTENPYFSVTGALRSRVQLIQLKPLSSKDIQFGLARAVKEEGIEVSEDACEWISTRSSGDLRLAFSVFEGAALLARAKDQNISLEDVTACMGFVTLNTGNRLDNHFDLASAYQKSLRGSDVNAAIYYLSRFLASGEDPRFIARRLLVTASEDVGNADPKALEIAVAAYQSVEYLGLPECRIPLSQATLYVARAPKSNESIAAIDAATSFLNSRPFDPIPAFLKNHQGDHGMDSKPDDSQFVAKRPEIRSFLPEGIKDQVFVQRGTPAKQSDTSSLWLLNQIKTLVTEDSWFDIDPEDLAKQVQWPLPHVRNALNSLVQEGQLEFKRCFRFPLKGKA